MVKPGKLAMVRSVWAVVAKYVSGERLAEMNIYVCTRDSPRLLQRLSMSKGSGAVWLVSVNRR